MTTRSAVFIDRDGVVVKNILRPGFKIPTAPFSLLEFKQAGFYDRVEEALRLLGEHGFLRILVTNQPDIAHFRISRNDWEMIQAEVKKFSFDDFFICFHKREQRCGCRKPKPGMLHAAQKKWDINLKTSWMVGDTDADTGAGRNAGCRTILLDRWYNEGVKSDYRVKDIFEAAGLVVSQESMVSLGQKERRKGLSQ